jgi:ATPase subunit of ABC transporter with duplicated ATPase domains
LEPAEKPWEGWELRFAIGEAPRAGAVVARLDSVVMRRGSFRLGPVDLEISWGERIALAGPNGSGKTTLVQGLLGRVPLESGNRWIGPSVVVGELDQAGGALGANAALLAAFMNLTRLDTASARSLLAKFGLGTDQVLRPVESLSPGERTRAELAVLQARGVNFLVLDEPTNHLDLPAVEELEEAIAGYAGSLLVITHDRRLLSSLDIDRTVRVNGGWCYKAPHREASERPDAVAP